MTRTSHHIAMGIVALGATLGCTPDDQTTGSLDTEAGVRARSEMDSTVLAHLDSGTSAYREGSLEEAGRHYRAAAEADPELAAAWFGIYMVENALGDAEAADSALQKARSLAPGASIIHPTAADTGGS